ncbi:MAG: FtsW/RodA/SpoVE family cell cycle protein, partial [bacterium]|nr:FtsW/RodA/SpoVE family cell cycle protein [bacterium]
MFKKFFQQIDLYLFIPSALIILLSFFVLSSFDSELARVQLLFAFTGYLFYLILMKTHPSILKEYAWHLYLIGLFFLVIVFAIGEASHGANRWIPIWGNINFQPSEFAKPVIIVLLSTIFSRYQTIHTSLIVKTLIPTLMYFFLIYFQPDLATAIVFLLLWMLCIYFSDTSFKVFLASILVLTALIATLSPIAWNNMHDYQKNRILVYLEPERDPLGTG